MFATHITCNRRISLIYKDLSKIKGKKDSQMWWDKGQRPAQIIQNKTKALHHTERCQLHSYLVKPMIIKTRLVNHFSPIRLGGKSQEFGDTHHC